MSDAQCNLRERAGAIPVMRHRLKYLIIELNGPRNHKRGVGRLGRHVDGSLDLCLVFNWLSDLGTGWFQNLLPLFSENMTFVVFETCRSFGRKGRVEFKERFRLQMSGEEIEACGSS